MQIILDDNNLIVAYADVGSLEGGIEIDHSNIPNNFMAEFRPGKFKYEEETIIFNKDYTDTPNPDTLPSNTMQEEIDSLKEQIAELTTIVSNLNN